MLTGSDGALFLFIFYALALWVESASETRTEELNRRLQRTLALIHTKRLPAAATMMSIST